MAISIQQWNEIQFIYSISLQQKQNMSNAISQQSIEESRYKTIPSEEKTRYPTTTKKKDTTPSSFLRTYQPVHRIKQQNIFKKKAQSLRQSLQHIAQQRPALQMRRRRFIEEQKYKKAMQVSGQITRAKSLLTQSQLKRLKIEQIKQKKSIKSAYHYQLKYFEQAWNRYFRSSKQKEKQHLSQFEKEKVEAFHQINGKLAKKCHSLRNKSAQIIQLQKQEQYYKRKGNTHNLSLIKLQKSKMKSRIKKQRESLIMKWTKIEEELINRTQQRKYQILMNRLKQQKKDQQRAYLQQKSRLKQKFKNVMNQLKHQQKMILNFASMRIDQIKIN